MKKAILITSIAISMAASAQAAQDTSLEAALTGCMSVADESERLACFEAIAAPIQARAEAEALPKAEKERRFFGFAAKPKPVREERNFGVPQIPEDKGITEITSVIRGFGMRQGKANRIELDNGQIWQQLSSDTEKLKVYSSTKTYTATVKKAALGSFRMTIEPLGKTIRVRRVQ